MSDGRKPDITLRNGAVSVSAWCEQGNDGKPWWKTVQVQRSYESPKGSGNWKYGPTGGRDIPTVIQLLTQLNSEINHKQYGVVPADDGQVDLSKYSSGGPCTFTSEDQGIPDSEVPY